MAVLDCLNLKHLIPVNDISMVFIFLMFSETQLIFDIYVRDVYICINVYLLPACVCWQVPSSINCIVFTTLRAYNSKVQRLHCPCFSPEMH